MKGMGLVEYLHQLSLSDSIVKKQLCKSSRTVTNIQLLRNWKSVRLSDQIELLSFKGCIVSSFLLR